MMTPKSLSPGLAVLLSLAASLTIAADKSTIPEPKVTATVEASAKNPAACIIDIEVRNPDTNVVLAAPNIAGLAGQEAISKSGDDKATMVKVVTTPSKGCTGGSYAVTVTEKGKVRYEKHGDLKAKS